MAHYLVIVESPAKIKTVKKFLGSNYTVMASGGHVRDLPKSDLGVDFDNDYEPKYITIRGKGPILASLRKEVKKSDKVYLATDPDREGEAISWHLVTALNLDPKKTYRITFNEITKDAVKNSIKNARQINQNLVDAQQGRRILDRIVGYEISPVLWAKVKRGLSAGRVQSVALKMISDREKEIEEFIPSEYWSLDANLKIDKSNKNLITSFYGKNNKKLKIINKSQVSSIIKDIENKQFTVNQIKTNIRENKAPLPFTTSTLQQEAYKALNFGTSKTMRIAQQLYEGLSVKGEGTVAFITYLRTDSTRVSDFAKESSATYIVENFGKEYLSSRKNVSHKDVKIQDAHEAIRPTDVFRTPAQVKDILNRDQFRLYSLIWKRFIASQMANSKYEVISVKINVGEYIFNANTSRNIFLGFNNIYTDSDEIKEKENVLISKLTNDTKLTFESFNYEQHFTKPKAHYTEATLVKELEDNGIGRPSTYAPTIDTLIKRRYVAKEGKNIFITEIGTVVNAIMEKSFSNIVDIGFTANMENSLDKIEEGELNWKDVIRDFYPNFSKEIETAQNELKKIEIKDEESDEICELCGRRMVIKYGPFGKFLACPGFPECHNTKPYLEKIGIKCPNCGKELVERRTKKGRIFYGCEDYEKCKFMTWQKPVEERCPKCGSLMVKKGKIIACINEQCGFTK